MRPLRIGLGPRLALVTTLLAAGVLGLSTAAFLRVRRGDLEADLREQARQVALVLAGALEPIAPATAEADLARRIALVARTSSAYQLETLMLLGRRQTDDAGWLQLVELATIRDEPAGALFLPERRAPFFAMALPLHDAPAGSRSRRVVAVLGLKRPTDAVTTQVIATARRALPLAAGGVALFAMVVLLLVRSTVVSPLRRLVEAIDGVSRGDLSRALLPEREDEVGRLAGRFNAMTNSLRQARQQEAREQRARSALEARLRQSEKLATMGQMAAEIAHEVGTPLNVIGGRARAITKRAGDPAEVIKNAEIVGVQVERIAKIIRQVLDFSRKSRPTLTDVDVGQVATEALGFLEESFRRQSIETELRLPAQLPRIPGDGDEIQQVCLNLLSNALHAMPRGGKLTLAIEAVERRKEGLALSAPARFLMVEIADTGVGVPAPDREVIFEPFFTTKDTGEGTGLGLAVSKGIVKDHDGWIEVDDRSGGGAVFRVFLPVAGAKEASLG